MEIFEELFSQNPIGILIWSKTGQIKYMNQSLLGILKYKIPPSHLQDCASKEENLNESNLLGILHNTNKKFKTYTKEFFTENKESVRVDIMTSLVNFKEDTYYYSQIRKHKSNISHR